MKDTKRINRISKLIGKIWRKNPNLRLCQLIENCAKLKKHKLTDELYKESMYYLEDEELEQRLKEVYLNIKPFTSTQLKKLKKALERRLREPYSAKDNQVMKRFIQPILILFGILPLFICMIIGFLSMYIVIGLSYIIERLINVGN